MTAIWVPPTHIVEVVIERQIGPITWYRCVCSCGSRSPMHGTKVHVQQWGERHVKFYATGE